MLCLAFQKLKVEGLDGFDFEAWHQQGTQAIWQILQYLRFAKEF